MEYNVVPITAGLLIIYLISWVASKKGLFSVAAHRKLWNAILLLTFAIAGITGMLIAIRADTGISVILFERTLWHGQFGVAAVVVAAFHILWHLSYFQAYLPRPAPKKTGETKEGTA